MIITLAAKHDPDRIVGWFDGSNSKFSTDQTRAINFDDLDAAWHTLGELRLQLPRVADFISVR
jgi:hypothetical protein